jgi:integrase
LLGRQRHKAENIPALNWSEVPAFYQSLDDGSVTHLALRLLILTGVRSGPLRHLRVEQIDGNVWTIPPEAMKGRKGATSELRVPLSPEALTIIDEARRHGPSSGAFDQPRECRHARCCGHVGDVDEGETYLPYTELHRPEDIQRGLVWRTVG